MSNSLLGLKIQKVNITQWLNKHEGGKWKYDGHATWWCDDGERHLSRVAMDFTDEDCWTGYHLYGGKNPRWIYSFTDYK